ncbi:gliding motility-associated C-terminal domain-containing protein [Flaviramulus basaltis]|uniref:Gliding motility-associated C-terminal domain-containing protein n=1 Tax=Flaviramulus basaltis TaxID=369401 RepID=A0A1K2INT3_9FLAO|nr:T9SS type B sorting domain-containing protein [Flaviramulus basaltis]SFZ93914.1 gliding motility-associated C-terminal domain-containing protein [Flaviramulus basaltis]
MKNKFLFIAFLTSFISFSQCPSGDLFFENQSELDQFIFNYPNCTKISGQLFIQSSSINNFSPLSNIEEIEGPLIIYNIENIDNLSGFENLNQVGGLDIASSSFKSLDGLNNLKIINGPLTIGYNFDLNDISSLNSLTTVLGIIGLRYLSIENLSAINNINYDTVTSVDLVALNKLQSISSESLCNYFKNGGYSNAIENNTPGFNSINEIIANCTIVIPSSSAELTGVWNDDNSVWKANICNTKIMTSVSGLQNGASVVFSQEFLGCNMVNTYSSNIVVNEPALGVYLDYNGTNGGVGVLTFTFSREVENPIIHIDKIGGYSGFASNSVLLRLIDSNLSLTKLSANDLHFEVTSNTITRTPGASSSTTECGLPSEGSAAGSVQINGVFKEVSFQFELNGEDGIGDLIEIIWELASCDFDQDGIIDKVDLDDDNDGILDTVELNGNPLLDTDSDGLIDSLDLDSDNDGCFDVTEAGFQDPDANGTLGDLPDIVDSDGLIINELDGYTAPLDVDANSVFDFQEDNRPLIITQPINSFTICEQDNLIISISVSNSSSLQWQVSIDLGLTWLDLDNDAIYSGVNTKNLELSNIPLSYNDYWFRARLDEFCDFSVLTDVVKLTVLKIPYTGIDGEKVFCQNDEPEDLLKFLGDDPDTNGIWNPSLNSGTGVFDPSIDAKGVYTYTIDNGYCFDESTVSVRFSSEATSVTIDVVDNSSNNSISIDATGIGNYEYSIDGINYQDSNLFERLYPGIYSIYVKDKNGCGIIELEEDVLGYPKFFTPNNDGFNDYWNIKGGENTVYIINIYDRYGKLLKSFDNSSFGWNGKFNNVDMPSSDYWFHFITSEGRKIKGNFALKR